MRRQFAWACSRSDRKAIERPSGDHFGLLSERGPLVTIDAGFKSLSTDGGVAMVQRGPAEGAMFVFMGDEHAAQIAPEIGRKLRPGDAVSLTVPHCDPTVNLYDFYHVVRGDTLIDLWPVSARGRAR